MNFRARRVSAHEWIQLRDARLEALREAPDAFESKYAEERMKSDAEWQDRALQSSGAEPRKDGLRVATFVLEQIGAGHWAGMATVLEEREAGRPQAQLVGVYVQPPHRSRRVGAAEALIRETLDWACGDVGAQRVRLVVREDNQRAIAFYRRLGFGETGWTFPYPPDPSLWECEMEYRGA